MTVMAELQGLAPAPPAAQLFANAGREHMAKYGAFVWSYDFIDDATFTY